jgi:peptide/nickel transport system substrate-binding protein
MEDSSKTYSRRDFLKLAGIAGAAVAAAGGLGGIVAACGGGTTTTTAATTATTAAGTATTGGTGTTAAGTATTSAGQPAMGGVAKIGVMSSPGKFGVPADVIGPDQWFEGIFLEGMFYPTDKPDEYLPALAESWEMAADKSAYTFHLRKGVKFTDGTDFNAQACKFCWDLMVPPADAGAGAAPSTDTTAAPPASTDTTGAGAAPAGPPGPAGPPPDFAFVKSIELVDDYTVKVNLKYWSNQVLPFIGRKSWAVFSPTAYQQMGKDKMDMNPVGTGAFTLKSFTPNQEMVLAKNPTYWMKDAQGQQLPYLDGVDIIVFKDPTTMTVAVQSGQIDGADHISYPGAKQLASDPTKYTLNHFGGPVAMMEVNTSDPSSVWSDKNVRQALEYAVDKEGISKSVTLGFEPPVYTIIHSLTDVADPGTTPRKYDPEKAKQLITASGKQIPAINISFNSTEGSADAATAIQANLAAIGITAKLNGMPSAAFAPISTKPPTGSDIIMGGERGGSPNVLQGAVEMFGKGTIYFPGSTFPDQFYTLMDQAGQVATLADTFPVCVQMEKIGYDDATVIPVTMQDFIAVSGPKLKNMKWTFANTPTPWFLEAWLTK